MRLTWLLLAMAIGASGCSCDEAPAPTTVQPATPPADIPSAGPAPSAPPPAPPAPSRTRDLHGLQVTLEENGHIRLAGADRWGGRVDTTYENAEFFRNAVPVLSRSVTDEQAADLRALADELGNAPTKGP